MEEIMQKSREIKSHLPTELTPYLPNMDSIELISCGIADTSVGKRWIIGYWMEDDNSNGPYVQYLCRTEIQNSIFANSFHPFIGEVSSRTIDCAERLKEYIGYEPYLFEITKDWLKVSFTPQFYDEAYYYETAEFIRYKQSYRISYHEGGGSGLTEWVVYKTSNIITPETLLCEKFIDGIKMPLCKGYWEKDGHYYLVDPWGISGVFEFHFYERDEDYAGSDMKIKTIGVNLKENGN